MYKLLLTSLKVVHFVRLSLTIGVGQYFNTRTIFFMSTLGGSYVSRYLHNTLLTGLFHG